MKCGDTIRLEHMQTNRNLHSHELSQNFKSSLSQQMEVSGFGDDGEGDPGDNWVIECFDSFTGFKSAGGEVVKGSTQF